MHRIVVDIAYERAIDLEIWNFAEDVARTCARDGHARLDLAGVRRPIDRFVVDVHSAAHVRRLIKSIETTADKHHVGDRVLVSDEKFTP